MEKKQPFVKMYLLFKIKKMCDFAIAMLGFGGGRTQPILGYWKCPYLRSMIRMTIYNGTSRSMVLVWDTGS